MPKVSVIIPVYNVEKYLEKCLNSVCNQTLKDIEIICVNDCSTDKSLSVLKKYSSNDSRLKVINFKKNSGVSEARNAALDIANGEYVGFVDSDDWVDLNFYESLYSRAVSHGCDIVKGDMKELLIDGSIRTYPINKQINDYNDKFIFRYAFSTAIYKLDNIKKCKLEFPKGISYGEDLLFISNNVKVANKVSTVDNVYYYYDRREDSADSAMLSDEKVISVIKSLKEILLNLNSMESTSSYAYAITCDWIIGVGLTFFHRNSNIKIKKECVQLSFYLFKNAKENKHLYDILNKKYTALLEYVKDSDFDGCFTFLELNNTPIKVLMANARCAMKKREVKDV